LINYLRRLDRKEMTRFVAFAHSPYHHKHKDTRALIRLLASLYPDFPDEACRRERLWSCLYPKQAHDQAKLALLFTYAVRVLESFLVQETLREDPHYQQLALLRQLRKRKLYHRYEKVWQGARQQHSQLEQRDANYYRAAIELTEEGNLQYVQRGTQEDNQLLEEKEQALDQYYLLEKLRGAVEMQVRSKILQLDYSARLLESVLQEIRENEAAYRDSPAIQVYYALYLLMQKQTLDAYAQVRSLFRKHELRFPADEQAAIYIYLQNFCIARINQYNDEAYLRELFRLYQEQLERKLLHEDGYLIEWHYKNIVTTGIRLGELEWVGAFVENAKAELAPHAMDNAYRFNKAAYAHAVRDYDQVLELLTQVEYSDLRYNLGSKALLLRTYYEVEAYEALHALVESFRQYLQRKNLMAASRRSGYYHLFRLTRRLAALRARKAYASTDKFQKSLLKIKEDLRKTESIFNRQWLEEKVRQLEK
ncbi:MAG: hypothetical protein D6772_04785, partial [Bacteroidetes bacterium]